MRPATTTFPASRTWGVTTSPLATSHAAGEGGIPGEFHVGRDDARSGHSTRRGSGPPARQPPRQGAPPVHAVQEPRSLQAHSTRPVAGFNRQVGAVAFHVHAAQPAVEVAERDAIDVAGATASWNWPGPSRWLGFAWATTASSCAAGGTRRRSCASPRRTRTRTSPPGRPITFRRRGAPIDEIAWNHAGHARWAAGYGRAQR